MEHEVRAGAVSVETRPGGEPRRGSRERAGWTCDCSYRTPNAGVSMSDRNVPMLVRMFEKRLRAYRAMGYELDAELATNLKDEGTDEDE